MQKPSRMRQRKDLKADDNALPLGEPVDIGHRLRELREAKGLSQTDMESRSGLLRYYLSRVENGHTVPSVGTLEKLAAALEIPLYQLFYEKPSRARAKVDDEEVTDWASRGTSRGKGFRTFRKLRQALARMDWKQREMLLGIAVKLANRK